MSIRLIPLAALLLLPLGAWAQPLPDRRPIVGVAVDGDGKPLEGALITIRRESDSGSVTFWGGSTASNARGAFSFSGGEVGRYFVNGERAGYAPISNQWTVWTPNSAPLRLQFQPLLTLRLQIARPDGTPLRSAPLWVLLRGDGNAGQTTRNVQSDSGGGLILDNLLPATTSIFVAGAEGFSLQNGVELRRDASQKLVLQAGGGVRGVVRDAANRPIGGAVLSLQAQSGAEATRLGSVAANPDEDYGFIAARGQGIDLVSRDGDGVIDLENVPPGKYRATIRASGTTGDSIKTFELRAGETQDLSWNVALKAETAAALTLQLKTARSGQPIAGAFRLRLLPIAENGALQPEEPTLYFPGGHPGRRAMADKDGQMTLFPLAPGRYRVFLSPQEAENGPALSASLDVTVPLSGATATFTLPIAGVAR